MPYKITRIVPERQGWDVTIELSDDIRRQCMTFYWPEKDKPDDKILAEKILKFEADFIADALIKPDVWMTIKEVESLLIEKGYLEEDQKLSDLQAVK